jgi:hypothetical protein
MADGSAGEAKKTPLEELLEKRGTPGEGQVPVSFIELMQLKDVLPLEKNNGSSSHS